MCRSKDLQNLLVSFKKLTYQKVKGHNGLDEIAGALDSENDRMKCDPLYRW